MTNLKLKTAGLFLSLALVGIFGFAGAVGAQGGGAVVFDFESKPLFNELNLLPGDSVSRRIAVQNSTNTPRQIGLKLYDVSDDSIGILGLEKFSSKFRFDVKKNGASMLPGGAVPLKTLFDGGLLTLETLPAGASATYYFELAFDASAGNDYQGKSLGFSLCVLIDGECAAGTDEPGPAPQTLITRAGGGIGGDRARAAGLSFSDHQVETFCRGDGTAAAMFLWKTDAPAVGRVLYSPAGAAKFDPSSLPDFGWRATAWGVSPAAWHAGFAFGLILGQSYDWRLDMSSSGKGRLTTQSLGTFVASCAMGAFDEMPDEDIFKKASRSPTGVLGEMTDEEVAQLMADLRARNQNEASDNDKPGKKIASAGFASPVLAATNAPAQNSPQNSAKNSGAAMLFALLTAAAFSGWLLATRLDRG